MLSGLATIRRLGFLNKKEDNFLVVCIPINICLFDDLAANK